MKARKFSKKLVLNKKTIANLNNGEMRIAYGGAPTQVPAYPKTQPTYKCTPPDPTSCVCTGLVTDCEC